MTTAITFTSSKLDLELFEQRENYIKIDTLHWTILSITLAACGMNAIVQ